MSVRMRLNKSQTAQRRSHHKLVKPAVSVDSETKTPHLRHRASPISGTYRGRQVIDVAKKAAKKVAKLKESEK